MSDGAGRSDASAPSRRTRVLGAAVSAALVGIGLVLVPVQAAEADPDTCGTNCVLVPTPTQDPALGVDNTGATDASLPMMEYFAHVAADRHPSAANPITVRLQPNSVYWLNYGIQFKYDATTNGNNVWSTRVVPTLPAFDLSFTTLDLNGATIDQCFSPTSDPTAYNACVTNWNALGASGKRLHNGNPIVSTAGATDVTLDGNSSAIGANQYGKLVNSAFGKDPARWKSIGVNLPYPSWQGVRIAGSPSGDVAQNITVLHTDIQWVGGDFVVIAAPTSAFIKGVRDSYDIENVRVTSNTLRHSARQGVNVAGGSTISIDHNTITDTGRVVFDSEPTVSQGSRNVTISDNVTTSGGIGYLNWNAGPLGDDFSFRDNVLMSPGGKGSNIAMLVTSAPGTSKHGVTITGNAQDQTGVYGAPVTRCYTKKSDFMIRIKNYDHATVQDNTNFVKFPAQGVIVQGTGDPTTNVTAPNNFLNDPVVCA